jgi:PAS domain-containing protein
MDPPLPCSAAAEDFADLVENAPCGYLVTDANGLITLANGTFSRWTEWTTGCQTARNRDPLWAPNRDPLFTVFERRGA